MGEKKEKEFEIMLGLEETDETKEGVFVANNLDATIHNSKGELIRGPIDTSDNKAVGKAIKEAIEDWLEKHKGEPGYKKQIHSFYNYDLDTNF